MTDEKILTEERVREIAREEVSREIKKISLEIKDLRKALEEQGKILARLERLLLGEIGVETEDTLKARANFAYQHAKKDEDLRITERVLPMIEWYEDWRVPEEGSSESKFSILGKMITAYTSMKWLLAVLAGAMAVNAVQAIKIIIDFIGR